MVLWLCETKKYLGTPFISAIIMLFVAGRIYKNGLLRFNHRLRFRMLLNLEKK